MLVSLALSRLAKTIISLSGPCVLNGLRPCADPERGTGDPHPREKGFLSNTCLDPINFTKLPSQHSMLGRHRTPAKRQLNGVSVAGR